MSDDPFLAAIQADPLDRTARLAYADWLEERGDPRAELVGVCEAMRDEPVWSDRYWELKARRNELWTRVPLDWLEASGYDGSFYDPIFRDGVPDDTYARWRLIREFTERWHGVVVPDLGRQGEAIREIEAQLDLSLPPSVCELAAFTLELGNYWLPGLEPKGFFPPFHSAYTRLVCMRQHAALSLIHCTLDGSVLGVLLDDLEHVDPQVFVFSERWSDDVDYDEDGQPTPRVEEPYFCAERLTRAVSENLFTELPVAGSMSKLFADPSEILAHLKADFPIHATFDGADVFERDEMFVYVGPPRSASEPVRYVSAFVRRELPRASLPPYLFGDEERDTSSTGILMPERYWQMHAANRWREPRWQSPSNRIFRHAQRAAQVEPPRYTDGDEIPF